MKEHSLTNVLEFTKTFLCFAPRVCKRMHSAVEEMNEHAGSLHTETENEFGLAEVK